ncbi:hypothetical protein SAMN05216244_0208 [Sediminibacillus halophilus]|uniref:DUF2332 domain-containing protein n=1 Tax=Sediminibacillus halophilus TaxID=482461 RepID=A0A1G9LNR7_9BACI|nr:hypothetical protein SAMN05216244_0208 [Sediminibacillus halophilus]
MRDFLSERFQNFSLYECRGSSRLYECLATEIANDDELLRLSEHAREDQPTPNLLLGAVHYLLQRNDHPLKRFYASLTTVPDKPEEAFYWFKDFCLKNEKEIKQLLIEKLVQTNEVRRCTYLYPIFCHIYRQTKQPLSLIELGSSAGLQLLWDKYAYRYDNGSIVGNANAQLVLTAEMRGGQLPLLIKESPPVAKRIGVDLHINHLNDPEDYAWLKALIWPEHHTRRTAFEQAVVQWENEASNLTLMEGNGVDLLEEVAAGIPLDSTICVFHTHVANQIPTSEKKKLKDCIKRISRYRDIFHIYNNMSDRLLHIDRVSEGKESHETVGRTDGHGSWFEWLLEQ